MMKNRLLFTIIFLLFTFSILVAEVSAFKNQSNYLCFIFMYKEPPYNEIWKQYEQNPNRITLNKSGDLNNDGKPSFGINKIFNSPGVVWSHFDENDYEISYSYYINSEWSNFEMLTDDEINDLDPSLCYSSEGKTKVVWWADDSIPQVYYKIRRSDGTWSPRIRISNPIEISKYPSIAEINDLSLISYETTLYSSKIIYATVMSGSDDPDPHPFLAAIGSSLFISNSIPLSNHESDHIWVDWIYDENYLCWSEKINDNWTEQRYEPYIGSNDVQRARLQIKIKVLNGQ